MIKQLFILPCVLFRAFLVRASLFGQADVRQSQALMSSYLTRTDDVIVRHQALQGAMTHFPCPYKER